MTSLTLTENMPERFEPAARRVFMCVGDDFFEVSGGKQWIRVSIESRSSIYFYPLKNSTIVVNIEGGAIDTYFDSAVSYWGDPYYRYYAENQNKEYLKWRVTDEDFYSSVKPMMEGIIRAEDDIDLISDIDLIYNDENLRGFEKQALAKQRIGHSAFSRKVKSRAGNSCLINPAFRRNLIASHIKPWSESVDAEKVDIANGLCLSPNYDGLFEDGAISFNDDGTIIISSCLSESEKLAYGLIGSEVVQIIPEHKKYLAWHRDNKFVNGI